MKEELSVVGKRLPQWAAHDKVTGTAKYIADINLPGTLAGKVLTSPHAHARIKKIDKSKAEKLPGVEAVITWHDIPQKLFNPSVQESILHDSRNEIDDMYILSEKARFAGDLIAAVAAVDEATAEKAIELIDVDYEVLPAVFDPLEAMKPGAPVIHDFAPNNISKHFVFPPSRGDIEQGFKDADVVVEATFQTSKQHMTPIEPCVCISSFDASGKLTVWSSTQRPFAYRTELAELFDIKESMINVICKHLGGGFGEANWSIVPVCVALAKKAKKPVKLEFSRKKSLVDVPTREAYIETGKLGAKKDGTLTALKENVIVHSGAYYNRSAATTVVNMGQFIGLYRCPNVYADMTAVYTNIPTSGGCRGYGTPEACFLLEQLVDMAAEKIGIDPVEMRIKNLKKVGDPSQTGMPIETYTQEKCIRTGAEKIGWKEKRAQKRAKGSKRYGVGMATFFDVSGGQPFEIFDRNMKITLDEDGAAIINTGIPDVGANLPGTAAQIAAEVLGLRYEDIHIVNGNTDDCLWDPGIGANSGLYGVGNVVIKVATELKKQILERAAKNLGVPPDELDIKDRKVYVKADPNKNMTVAEVSKAAIYNHEGQHHHIFAKGWFEPTKNPSPTGAAFADVEVDIETGEIKISKLVFVQDSGRIINPVTVEGQLDGGIACGLGYALFEDYYTNPKTGVLESDNFNTYKIPSSLDLPDTEVILVEEPTPSGPFGAKGVGMCGVVPIAAAIANAVYDAVGIRIKGMPLTPEKVLKAIKSK